MPLQVFIALVYGICSWLGLSFIEPLMRSFAVEAGMSTWLFIAVPGLLAMLFSVVSYRHAEDKVTKMEHSMTRGLLVGLATWSAVALLITWLWCPVHSLFSCLSSTLIASGIVGGGPLLIGTMVAGAIVGIVLRARPSWIAFRSRPAPAAGDIPALDAKTDAR
jgi:hypothetical protein